MLKKLYPWSMRHTDPTPYGTALAERVADYLERVGDIKYEHKDYCGTGFAFRNGEFIHGDVSDGLFGDDEALHRLSDRITFVAWLAQQSDQSLSGAERDDGFYPNNQRITRKRLELAVGAGPGDTVV